MQQSTKTDLCSKMEKAGVLDVGVFSSFEVQLILLFISVSRFFFCPGSHNLTLGKPSRGKSDVFLNIVQKAFDPPPPLLFEHLSYFAGGIF